MFRGSAADGMGRKGRDKAQTAQQNQETAELDPNKTPGESSSETCVLAKNDCMSADLSVRPS